MDSDLKLRIEKLKRRKFPYKSSEGKWGFTDVFGKIVEPAHLDYVENNPYDFKGIRHLDKKLPLSYRELITRYTDYRLPDSEIIEFSEEEHEKFRNVLWDTWLEGHKVIYEKEILIEYNDYIILREDLGKVDIDKRGIVRYGYQDKLSNNFTKCIYDEIFPFKEGLARVFKSDKTIDLPYPECRGCSFLFEDFKIYSVWMDDKKPLFDEESIMEEGQYGFINKEGNSVIPCKYEEARDFSDGLAAVAGKGGWGYIDKNNNVVIPFFFEDADDFIDGFARVLYAGLYYVIDKEGYCYESFDEIEIGQGSKFYL